MRATNALCFLLLSGCASRTQPSQEAILHPGPEIVQINGTVEREAFVVDQKQAQTIVVMHVDACQTNDPMPVARLAQPTPQMPHSQPLRVAPMPNACPVTVPWSNATVFTSAPVPPKTAPAPVPAEPQQ